MISIQNRFLFIHVPKTGGNSIANILRDFSEDEITTLTPGQDGVERFGVANPRWGTSKHSSITHYKSVLDKNTYNSLFKFATIRNPWERVISNYFGPHRGVKHWDRDLFLRVVEKTRTLSYYVHERSIPQRILLKFGHELRHGKKELNRDIDFLIRFERLDDDFKTVCEKIDIPYTRLPQRNASVRNHYSTYYDEELMEIVRKKFAKEISFGQYHFEEHDDPK